MSGLRWRALCSPGPGHLSASVRHLRPPPASRIPAPSSGRIGVVGRALVLPAPLVAAFVPAPRSGSRRARGKVDLDSDAVGSGAPKADVRSASGGMLSGIFRSKKSGRRARLDRRRVDSRTKVAARATLILTFSNCSSKPNAEACLHVTDAVGSRASLDADALETRAHGALDLARLVDAATMRMQRWWPSTCASLGRSS